MRPNDSDSVATAPAGVMSAGVISTPFAHIKVRYLLIGCFVYFVAALMLVVLLSPGSADAASAIFVISAGLYVVALVWLLHQVRGRGLEPQALAGDARLWRSGAYLVWLAIPLQLASYGLTWLMGNVLSYIMTPRPGRSGSAPTDFSSAVRDGWLYPVWLIIILVFGPIIEELVFRGVILNRWAYKWGVRRGVIFSSILFGLLHRGFVWAFAVGVVLSLMYIATRTLVVPILCHIAVNVLSETGGILDHLIPWSDSLSTRAGLQRGLFVTISFLLGVVPVSLFVLRHWPARGAPIPYSA